MLLYTNSLILLAGAMFGPIYSFYVMELGGGILAAGITGGVFALSAVLTTFVTGRMVDRSQHPVRILITGYTALGVGFLALSFSQNIWHLVIVQVFIGVAHATYAPSFDVLYTKHMSRHKVGRGWGGWEATNYISSALGASVGGAIVTLFGFTALFVAMGALCLIGSIVVSQSKKRLD